MELELEELEAAAGEDGAALEVGSPDAVVSHPRRKPKRAPLPEHLPRERVVLPSPSSCPCCGGVLSKLGEDITETLELVPRRWKVIQTVREKFSCRRCEAITQAPAPFHPIARGRAGPNLLATILEAKFAQHLPLNRRRCSITRRTAPLPKQRNTTEERQALKEGRIPDDWKASPAKLRHKDRDARWTVKFTRAKERADGSRPPVDTAIPAFGDQNRRLLAFDDAGVTFRYKARLARPQDHCHRTARGGVVEVDRQEATLVVVLSLIHI